MSRTRGPDTCRAPSPEEEELLPRIGPATFLHGLAGLFACFLLQLHPLPACLYRRLRASSLIDRRYPPLGLEAGTPPWVPAWPRGPGEPVLKLNPEGIGLVSWILVRGIAQIAPAFSWSCIYTNTPAWGGTVVAAGSATRSSS